MSENTVYISYSKYDGYIAQHLQSELTKAGITALIDIQILKVGLPWDETLMAAIDRANLFILLVSNNSVNSDYVKREVDRAKQSMKRIVPILLTRDFQLLKHFEMLHLHTQVVESPLALEAIIPDIVDLLQPGLSSVVNTLYARQFDDTFVEMFRRLGRKTEKDIITLYYDSSLEFDEVVSIERAMNDVATYLLAEAGNIGNLALLLENKSDIVQLTSFTHPASTELVFELSKAALLILISSPDVRSFLIGFVTNGAYDIAKTTVTNSIRKIFAARKDEQWSEIDVDTKIIIPQTTIPASIQESVEKITRNRGYFGIKGGVIVWGTEQTSIERKFLPEHIK